MPPSDVHLKNSKERTGKEYEELHLWIDEKLNSSQTHDISKIGENIKYVQDRWGEEASKEFVLHLKEDMGHRLKEALQYFGLLK